MEVMKLSSIHVQEEKEWIYKPIAKRKMSQVQPATTTLLTQGLDNLQAEELWKQLKAFTPEMTTIDILMIVKGGQRNMLNQILKHLEKTDEEISKK